MADNGNFCVLILFLSAGYKSVKIALILPILNGTVFLKFTLGKGFCNRNIGFADSALWRSRPHIRLCAVRPVIDDLRCGLRDLSRKQRTAIRVKGESGKPTTNCAIYGYRKDPENKYHWLIDEEAAAVVRRIFRLTIEGKGPYDIARILFEDKVETPAVYFGKQGKGIWKSKEEFSNPYNWSGYVVGQILSKPEYMGHTVNFRSHKQSYKDKNAVMNPKEDWLIFEDI